jgi:hypothetical protein
MLKPGGASDENFPQVSITPASELLIQKQPAGPTGGGNGGQREGWGMEEGGRREMTRGVLLTKCAKGEIFIPGLMALTIISSHIGQQ